MNLFIYLSCAFGAFLDREKKHSLTLWSSSGHASPGTAHCSHKLWLRLTCSQLHCVDVRLSHFHCSILTAKMLLLGPDSKTTNSSGKQANATYIKKRTNESVRVERKINVQKTCYKYSRNAHPQVRTLVHFIWAQSWSPHFWGQCKCTCVSVTVYYVKAWSALSHIQSLLSGHTALRHYGRPVRVSTLHWHQCLSDQRYYLLCD